MKWVHVYLPPRLRYGTLPAPQKYHRSCPESYSYYDFFHQNFDSYLGFHINEIILDDIFFFFYLCSIFYLWDATRLYFVFLYQYHIAFHGKDLSQTFLSLLFIHRLLGCFRFVAIMTDVAISNTLVYVFWCMYIYTSLLGLCV